MNGTRHGVFVKGTSYSHRVCVYQSYHLIKCARQLLTTYSRWSEKNADSTVIKPLLSFRRTNFRRRHRGRATKLKMRRIEKKKCLLIAFIREKFQCWTCRVRTSRMTKSTERRRELKPIWRWKQNSISPQMLNSYSIFFSHFFPFFHRCCCRRRWCVCPVPIWNIFF